ncbi:MAG TPA: GNAT family N-acetyltransferase [Terriglobia bacterium]|nr:GNAT family N-acetyltransferase [Terriglobia bacterium]
MQEVKAPASFETHRLLLRRPQPEDAAVVFARYANDPEVTRFVGWPKHESVADTQAFLAFSDAEWERWQAGPYLIWSRSDGVLLGSTGLGFETPYRAATGYVLARDAWGRGYATEALNAMVDIAPRVGVQRLYALCHLEHRASWRSSRNVGSSERASCVGMQSFRIWRFLPLPTCCAMREHSSRERPAG